MMDKGSYGAGRYDGLDTNCGDHPESATAKKYQEKAQGVSYGHGAIPVSNPSQKGNFPSSLPDQSPEGFGAGKAGQTVANAKL